jgi:hypothetical protein
MRQINASALAFHQFFALQNGEICIQCFLTQCYKCFQLVGTGIEPLTASTRKSVVVAEREITEPRIVKVQNILAVDARESIRRGLSSAQTELQSKLGWDS